MSGHSHYSTIKRKKEAGDAAKGKVFSKMSRAITIAIKAGGNANPESNYKLRMAIDAAKAVNMPKNNIDRILSKASEAADLSEVRYEGFGPDGISVIIDVATDNRNRSGQEIKGIFERVGGSLAGPGAVSYNFENKGLIIIEKTNNSESQMLELIDLEVEDIEDSEDGIEIYTEPEKLAEIVKLITEKKYNLKSSSLIMKPKVWQKIDNPEKAKKAIDFLEKLEDHEDVQDVFTNLDISKEIVNNIK
jgi:YebC/PmpR family DNA-binding regulatory protein